MAQRIQDIGVAEARQVAPHAPIGRTLAKALRPVLRDSYSGKSKPPSTAMYLMCKHTGSGISMPCCPSREEHRQHIHATIHESLPKEQPQCSCLANLHSQQPLRYVQSVALRDCIAP
jgi:hypothetical protein